MKLAKLQQKRNDAAAKIRKMADGFKANGNKWANVAEKQEWDAQNAAYDAAAKELETLLTGDAGVAERATAVDARQSDPLPDPRNIGLEDAGGGRSNNPVRGGMRYRNLATGEILTALAPNESFTARNRATGLVDDEDEATAPVGELLHSMLTGRPQDLSRGQFRNAIGSNDSQGGYILNPELSSQIVDLARNASVVMRAGAQTLPMESRELAVARLIQDATPMWRPEGAAVTASTMTFDRGALPARTLAAIVPVSIELLEDAANAGQLIRDALQAAMGLELDRAALVGTGAENQPKGVRYNNITGVIGVGTPANYSAVLTAVSVIMNNNFPGAASELAWILNPRDAKTYNGLLDTTNQPLQPPPWARDLKQLYTNSLPKTGGGGTESMSLLGDFSQLVVGMRTSGVQVRILEAGQVTDTDGATHYAASELKKLIVAHMRCDVALLRPSWFSFLDGITP